MKKIIIILFLILFSKAHSQVEGQDFCGGVKDGDYFPLNIKKKKIRWYNTYYVETHTKDTIINKKTYHKYEQTWENATTDNLYLREDENGVLQHEECCEEETTRYSRKFKVGDIWQTAKKNEGYVVVSYEGELKTPYCNYKNLLIIQATLVSGVYEFYYVKGYGYVGAKKDNKLISWVIPK